MLTWFLNIQKTSRTRCPEHWTPKSTFCFLKSTCLQRLRETNGEVKWNKHAKITGVLPHKNSSRSPCNDNTVPTSESQVILNRQPAFSSQFSSHYNPMQNSSSICSRTSPSRTWYITEILALCSIRDFNHFLWTHKQLIHHIINQVTL